MANKLAYVAGLAGLAAIGWWIGVHRFRRSGGLREIDDDSSASLIVLYRPAIERALSEPA